MAGESAERQENGLVVAVKKAVKANQNNPDYYGKGGCAVCGL